MSQCDVPDSVLINSETSLLTALMTYFADVNFH